MEQSGVTAPSPAGGTHQEGAGNSLLTASASIAAVAFVGVVAVSALAATAVVKLAPAGLPW